MTVGDWVTFDLPLTFEDKRMFYDSSLNTSDLNSELFGSRGHNTGRESGEKKHFSMWIDGEHRIAQMEVLDGNLQGIGPTGPQSNTGENTGELRHDASDGERYSHTNINPKSRFGGHISLNQCLGMDGSHLGAEGVATSSWSGNSDLTSLQDFDDQFEDPVTMGNYDLILAYDLWGSNDTTRTSFKDVVIYKTKEWRVRSVQEYQGEYTKLSCTQVDRQDSSDKRRAYG